MNNRLLQNRKFFVVLRNHRCFSVVFVFSWKIIRILILSEKIKMLLSL